MRKPWAINKNIRKPIRKKVDSRKSKPANGNAKLLPGQCLREGASRPSVAFEILVSRDVKKRDGIAAK
jgi:hypothetical protein